VVFDYYDQRTSNAETGVPVPVEALLSASAASAAELAGPMTDWDAPDDRLDYALLKLPWAVGEDPTEDTTKRGWYNLDPADLDLSQSSFAYVFHFPLASYLSCSHSIDGFAFNPSGTRTRMRYRTNTLPGSSGAPLIDPRGRLLGIHHYGNSTRNQAVPIWLVAKAVQGILPEATPAAALHLSPPDPVVEVPPPHQVLQIGPRPMVNREPLRQKVWAAMTKADAARSLVIVGATESGISWSYWLLAHMAAKAPLMAELRKTAVRSIKIDLRETTAKPSAERRTALIRSVSRPLSHDIADEWVAQVARQVSDFKDWCYQQLMDTERQWWIFVDSIDEMTELKRHGIDEILLALVDLADDPQTNLRLVLAGREADRLGHRSLLWAASDHPVGLSREEVRRWLGARAKECGHGVRPDRVEAFLDRWFGNADTAARPVELALALPQAVTEVRP
jgi:hypothetical protein